MSDELEALVAEAKSAMSQAANLRELDGVRVAFLGKQGRLSTLMKGLGALPPEERKQRGAALNEARASIDLSLDQAHGVLATADLNARLLAEKQDMSLPARPIPAGSIHPINRTIEELQDRLREVEALNREVLAELRALRAESKHRPVLREVA